MNEHLYKKKERDIFVHDDFGLNETGKLERGKAEAENLEPEGLKIEDLEAALEENLEELSQLIAKGATPEKLQENDLAFHHLLGSCTTNPLLEQIYNIVIDFMEPSITATHKRQHGEYVYKVHSDMVDVIRTRNGERISEAVAASVDTWSSLQDL